MESSTVLPLPSTSPRPLPSISSSLSSSTSSPTSSSSSSPLPGYRQQRIIKWNVGIPLVTRLVLTMLVLSHNTMAHKDDGATEGSQSFEHSQRFRIFQAWLACNETITALEKPKDGGLYCEPVWDNVMCWPDYTPAGNLVQQPCAGYIAGFNTNEKAHRYCMEDGKWAIHPDVNINTSWTNFLHCAKKKESIDPDIAHHMPIITLISTVGYSISLAFLLVATVLMVRFKKLHCQRNTIHINLFLSFIFRAVVSLVKNGSLDKGFAFSWDFDYDEDGSVVFKEGTSHWECKLLNILHHYAIGANYTWIFVEGLFLHTLIFYAVFSQTKKFFKVYIIIGWCFPLIFVIVWIVLRVYKNNVLCWNTHEKNYYWILEAPIIASILINFCFFLNIIRVLFTKIRNCNTRDPRRFRKLAKSTLVLIPLFGVYYIIFIVLARHRHPDIAIVHMYLEMTLNSFQGIVVALLFCFFNGEVRTEISKRWNRHWLSRRYSSTSGRSSRAFSTSSFTLRERFSLSQVGSPMHDNKNHKCSPKSNRLVLNGANAGTDPQTSNSIETIPRVPSESKVTFSDVDYNDHGVNSNSTLPKGSQTGALSRDVVGDDFHQPEVGEQDYLLPGHNEVTSVNGTRKSTVSKNTCDSILHPSSVGLQRNPPSPLSRPFPSSNGLSLVRDPVKQNGTKKI